MIYRVILFLFLLTGLGMLIYYMQHYRPEMMYQLLIRIDVMGLTEPGNLEQQRLSKIRKLDIPYEQKEALNNRTVFIGASADMVQLALGEPNKILQEPDTDQQLTIRYIYLLPNDRRPTVFVFKENKLEAAFKSSIADIGSE